MFVFCERFSKMKTIFFRIFTFIILLYFAIRVHGYKVEDVLHTQENTLRVNSGTCGDNLYWELNAEGTLSITGTGYMGNYSCDGSPWDSDRSSIISIVIGEGVVSIGKCAFYYCDNLKDVKMPDSLELIGQSAFEHCPTMTNITIGKNVKRVMNYAFSNCEKIQNVSIGSSVTSIGTGVFSGCKSLSSIEVEKSNTIFSVINDVLFSNDNTILVQYPIGKTNVSYTVPDHVKQIGDYSFANSVLINVTISDDVTSIEGSAFSDCHSLVNVILPYNLIFIRTYAFYGCTNLKNMEFSNKLEDIGDEAYCFCNSLENITIPKSLKYIGRRAFSTGSSYMSSINVEDGNEFFKSIDGVLFNYNLTKLVQYPPGKKDIVNYVIPDSVKTVKESAFESSQLTSVIIPSGVEEMEDFVFRYCKNLTYVVFPEGVTAIGRQTFYGCSNLGNVTIPDSVNSIEDNAFVGCSNLKSVFYQGYNPISSSTTFTLASLTSLSDVCTPPGYTSDTFCGATVTPSSETCQTYQSFFGECTKGSCIDGVLVEEKWDNVTKWEQQTNECEVYQCDAVNGFISWWNCNTSDEMSRVCVKGQCIEKDTTNEGWTVEVEMNNVTLNEVNESNVIYILSNYSRISNMKIGMEVDDKGNVIHILIYVQDEASAKIIAKAVKEMKEGEDNLFRKTINVRVTCRNAFLSNGNQSMINFLLSLAPLLITLMITI